MSDHVCEAHPPKPRPLVRVHDLHVTLGGMPILRGLNADFARGKITALIGLNGSGKTTFLRAVLKEVPYQGQIEFHCGHDHTHRFPQHIGYVPQRLLFDPNLPLTVCELLSLGISSRPLALGIGRATKTRLEKMLARVWADRLMHSPVGSLSGGELQRVLLALAFDPEPELLLLDEPAAGIDFKHEGEFYGLIDKLNRETGVTVLLVSHDTSMVSKVAHYVLCLRDGLIKCGGSPGEVLTPEMVEQIFGAHKGVYTHKEH